MSKGLPLLWKGALWSVVLLLHTAGVRGQEAPPPSADYEVLFEPLWSAETHPGAYPEGARLGYLSGATHSDELELWSEAELASDGVRGIAELDRNGTFMNDVEQARSRGLAGQRIGLRTGEAATVQWTLTKDHPLVSLAVNLSPSPDWFAGVSGLSLLEEEGWVEHKVVELFAYDAGTDSGADFTSPDSPTDPPQPIRRITAGKLGEEPVARLTFQLVRAPSEHPLFQRGDTNSDGVVNLSDAIFLLHYLFLGGPEPSCRATGDTDDIGVLDVSSALRILVHLFGGLDPPRPPFLSCGVDADLYLSCESYPPCE
jgi:hypothetical protein